MGFVRAWWPPVVIGLIIAVVGIGLADAADLPAGTLREPSALAASAAAPPASVEPAAIEEIEASPRPAPSVAIRERVAPRRAPEPDPDAEPKAKAKPEPKPKPSPHRSARPPKPPQPKPTSMAPSSPPNVVPSPPTSLSPRSIVRPKPTPVPVRPAQVLDLRRWKLTLPAGRQGHPTEFRQPVLGSLASGSFIRLTADRGVAFRAPVGGVTTENSSYPRSELREMGTDGRREAAWSSASGRHVMTITQAITATPRAKPHVVAGQIHDAEDDVVMIRLEGRRLFVESDGTEVGLLDPRYRLGTRFTVSIVATRSGVGVVYNGRRTVRTRAVGRGWYFKAGCYPQSNPERGDHPAAYGEVIIYALTVRHLAP